MNLFLFILMQLVLRIKNSIPIIIKIKLNIVIHYDILLYIYGMYLKF